LAIVNAFGLAVCAAPVGDFLSYVLGRCPSISFLPALHWGLPPETAGMGKMTPRERAAMIKQVKGLNLKIQDPRLSIERVEELHSERAALHAKLLEDRAEH
jgi:hypothetical protein